MTADQGIKESGVLLLEVYLRYPNAGVHQACLLQLA